MATGTGKSYVIFAVAYLSILMGFVKKVFVLGPPSLVIEQGLREKFNDLMRKKELIEKLSNEYRSIKINLLTDNDAIEDYSIVVENINAVWGNRLGSIKD
jgi:type III restriction enzyme